MSRELSEPPQTHPEWAYHKAGGMYCDHFFPLEGEEANYFIVAYKKLENEKWGWRVSSMWGHLDLSELQARLLLLKSPGEARDWLRSRLAEGAGDEAD